MAIGRKFDWAAVPFAPHRQPWLVGTAIAAIALLGLGGWYALRSHQTATSEAGDTEITPAPIAAVTALGRIEPLGEAIALSAPPTLGGAKVVSLRIAEGDRVRAEQILAELDGYERYQAAYDRAQQEVQVALADLAVVQAGAKQGEIAAATAAIARLRAQLAGERQAQADKIVVTIQGVSVKMPDIQSGSL